jgi:hypothetical protein
MKMKIKILKSKKLVKKHYKRTIKYGGSDSPSPATITQNGITFRELLLSNDLQKYYKTPIFGKNDRQLIETYLGEYATTPQEGFEKIYKLLKKLDIKLYFTHDPKAFNSLASKETLKGNLESSSPSVIPFENDSTAVESLSKSPRINAKIIFGNKNKHVVLLFNKITKPNNSNNTRTVSNKVKFFNKFASVKSSTSDGQPRPTGLPVQSRVPGQYGLAGPSSVSGQTGLPRLEETSSVSAPSRAPTEIEKAIAEKISGMSKTDFLKAGALGVTSAFKAAKMALKTAKLGLKAMKQFNLSFGDMLSLRSGIVSREILNKIGYPNPPNEGIPITKLAENFSSIAANVSENPDVVANLSRLKDVLTPKFIAEIKDPNLEIAVKTLSTPEFSASIGNNNIGNTSRNSNVHNNPLGNPVANVSGNTIVNVPDNNADNNPPSANVGNNPPPHAGNVNNPVANSTHPAGNDTNPSTNAGNPIPPVINPTGNNPSPPPQEGGVRKKNCHTNKKRVILHKKRKVSRKHK